MFTLLAACGGFLMAVLWFDLMFDVQTLRQRRDQPLPEEVLASIAGYYRRVTIEAQPMSQAVAAAMLIAIGGSVWQLVAGALPIGRALVALALVVAPVLLAALRVVPSAQRLALRADPLPLQSELARRICTDHLFCLAAIALFVCVQFLPA